jgi:hypothetical protein
VNFQRKLTLSPCPAPLSGSVFGQHSEVCIQNRKQPGRPVRVIDEKVQAADRQSCVESPAKAKDCGARSLSRTPFPRFVSIIPPSVHETVQGQTAFSGKSLQTTQEVADAAADLDALSQDPAPMALLAKQHPAPSRRSPLRGDAGFVRCVVTH